MIPLTSSASTRDHEPIESVRPTNVAGAEAEPVPSRQDFLQYALEFRGWGWTILALNADKKPIVRRRRLQTHKASDRELCRMFDRPDVGGLAVVLGAASGGRNWVLGCRDFDAAAGYRHWSRSRPRLAEALPTVETRRGFHVYARMSGPDLFLSFPKGDMAGELRASRKQFTVLPPSLRGDSVGYRWRHRRPSSLNDFPVLRVEDTGFLEAIPSSKPGSKTRREERENTKTTCV